LERDGAFAELTKVVVTPTANDAWSVVRARAHEVAATLDERCIVRKQ
jgi:hypothetical protein